MDSKLKGLCLIEMNKLNKILTKKDIKSNKVMNII